MDFARVVQFLKSLEAERVEYVLVGGVAINVHGIVRATQHVDVFIPPDPDNVNRVKKALRQLWNDPEIEGIRPEDLAGDYYTIRYGPPGEDFVIDLIARLGEAYSFKDLSAETVSWEGIRVHVATPET